MAHFGSSQFRERAIVLNAQPETLDDRAELTAPREWAVLACLGLAVAALAAWGTFGSVERTLRSDCTLVLSGERRVLRSGESGAVAEVFAQTGERMTAGKTIARIVGTGTEASARFAAAAIGLLNDEAGGSPGAGRTEAERLLTSAQAVLDELAAVRKGGEVVSPGNGVTAAMLVTPGQTIVAGAPVAEFVSGNAGRLDAAAFVQQEDAWNLAPGMAARVTVESLQGARVFPAQLIEIAPRAAEPPDWLARMLTDAPTVRGRGHVLRLTVSDPDGREPLSRGARGGSLDDGTSCSMEIIRERTSPFGLLLRR